MEQYDFYFVNVNGTILYIYGKEVVRPYKEKDQHFLKVRATGQEYPWHWVKKQLTEVEKVTFVQQYNDMLKADYNFQRTKHPEDKYKFCPMSFNEIVNSIQDEQKYRAKHIAMGK